MTLYDPTVFNVAGERQAKAIILTPEAGMTTEERWERETPDIITRLGELIGPWLTDTAYVRVLDWGCGIGRLARPICHTFGYRVTGVDISEDMRRLAVRYVDHPYFVAEPPNLFEAGAVTPHYDAAIAAWSLQHIPKLERAVRGLRDSLKPDAPLMVLNRVERVIPVVGGWMSDGKDVPGALRAAGFILEAEEQLGPPLYAEGSVWSVWRAGA